MQAKLDHVERNGKLPRPDPTPTVFTSDEVNAYIASGDVDLPEGVKSVRLDGQPGIITGFARVDFDQIEEGRGGSSNPLLAIFSGTHDIVVEAHAQARNGEATVHTDSVSLDGVVVPRFVLKLFVEKYIQPKYPDIGLESHFKLENRVDTVTVGAHMLTVVQR